MPDKAVFQDGQQFDGVQPESIGPMIVVVLSQHPNLEMVFRWDMETGRLQCFIRERKHPKIICLCGSTRFSDAYQQANLRETLADHIVLTIGCDMRSDADLFAGESVEELNAIKTRLDALHLAKIDLADEVLILNVGGYVGESTRREIEYARKKGKIIRWLEPEHAIEA